jgi:hypothetical protein
MPTVKVLRQANYKKEPAVEIDFGVFDGKGRRMGCRYQICEFDIVEVEIEEFPGVNTSRVPVPGHYWQVHVQATRSGFAYGPSTNRSGLYTKLPDAWDYATKYVARARKSAERRSKAEAGVLS